MEAADTMLTHNTIVGAAGIDVRYAATSAIIENSLMSGSIRDRNGGTHSASSNLVNLDNANFKLLFFDPLGLDFSLKNGSEFVNKAISVPIAKTEIKNDFCGGRRETSLPDLGAIEYLESSSCTDKIQWLFSKHQK